MAKPLLLIVILVVVVGLTLGLLMALTQRPRGQTAAVPPAAICTGPLAECVERPVKFTGTVSNLMQQHLVSPRDGYNETSYLDNPNGSQIVIYTKQPLGAAVGKKIEVTGRAIKVATEGGPDQKLTEPYAEYQILVDSWREVL